jgi:mRNA interferase YafQ
MRTIERSSAFKRDFKRVKANPHHARDVDTLLLAVAKLLAMDQPLPENNRDHPLSGDWAGYRECHLKPDLLLVYRKFGDDLLKLARLGSHSELFG